MRTIGYLSMEIGLDASVPTYAGGLGILAGDTVRAAADLGLTFVAATLLYRDGYFTQRLDAHGQQSEVPTAWNPERSLEPVDALVSVPIFGRRVYIRAWRRLVRGGHGSEAFVYFLDTNLDLNHPADRNITDALYASGTEKRLAQEIVLGIGARPMLRAIGHQIDLFHLNEVHDFSAGSSVTGGGRGRGLRRGRRGPGRAAGGRPEVSRAMRATRSSASGREYTGACPRRSGWIGCSSSVRCASRRSGRRRGSWVGRSWSGSTWRTRRR